jgi:hypothetical protein
MFPTSSSNMLLVFRYGYEYVFIHGETSMLTVTLSTTAINLFSRYNMESDDLAKQAAEWAVLEGRSSGIVDLGPESEDFSEFCRYYFHHEALAKRAC